MSSKSTLAFTPNVIAAIHRGGYFVTHRSTEEGPRTYACMTWGALGALLYHLTGRQLDTFALDDRGLPIAKDITIAKGCHIYIFGDVSGTFEHVFPKTTVEG